MPTRRRLLGRLAELGWFTQMGEPAATQAVWMLLDDPILRAATLTDLSRRTGVDLTGVEWFVPESVYPDHARPDLEGMQVIDGEARPRVVVEMKFGAVMGRAQLLAYLRNQTGRLQGAPGALVVLVPTQRAGEAQRLLDEIFEPRVETEPPAGPIGRCVVTWTEWLDCWDRAAADHAESAAVRDDIAQLRAMCETLSGTFVHSFDLAGVAEWQRRESDLRELVRKVSEAVSPAEKRLLPARDMGSFWGRWIHTPETPGDDSYLAVALTLRFGDSGGTPLWVHLHRSTERFHQMRARIMDSPLGGRARHEEGSVWLPLMLPSDIAGLELVEAVTSQVEEIIAVTTKSPV